MTLIQMKPEYFRVIAKQGQYQRIPYTKVCCLMYQRNEPKVVKYKRHFSDDRMAEKVIERKATRNPVPFVVADPRVAKPTDLSQAKDDDKGDSAIHARTTRYSCAMG